MSNMQDAVFLDQPLPAGHALPLHVEPDCLHFLFDAISHGIVVVDPLGRVLHINRAAHEEVVQHGVLFVAQNELQTLSPKDDKLLQAALVKASDGIRSLVKLSGSGVTLMLSVIPLKHRHGSSCEQFALFFKRRAICDSVPRAGLRANQWGYCEEVIKSTASFCRRKPISMRFPRCIRRLL